LQVGLVGRSVGWQYDADVGSGAPSFGDTLRATLYAAGGYGRWPGSLEVQRCGRSEVFEVLEMLEVIHCALLCMLEAVEGRFCSLKALVHACV